MDIGFGIIGLAVVLFVTIFFNHFVVPFLVFIQSALCLSFWSHRYYARTTHFEFQTHKKLWQQVTISETKVKNVTPHQQECDQGNIQIAEVTKLCNVPLTVHIIALKSTVNHALCPSPQVPWLQGNCKLKDPNKLDKMFALMQQFGNHGKFV